MRRFRQCDEYNILCVWGLVGNKYTKKQRAWCKNARSVCDARVVQSRGKYNIREPSIVLLTTWEARIEPSGVDRTNACAGDRSFKVHSYPKFGGFWCKATCSDKKIVRFCTSTGHDVNQRSAALFSSMEANQLHIAADLISTNNVDEGWTATKRHSARICDKADLAFLATTC